MLYSDITGDVLSGIQLSLNYHPGIKPTNMSATPEIRDITLRNIDITVTKKAGLVCEGKLHSFRHVHA